MNEKAVSLGALNTFLIELKDMNEKDFFTPIADGKWSAAAIVAHLYFWDQYFLEERLPFMTQGAKLAKIQIDINKKNKQAEDYAHSGISMEELIDQTIEYRRRVVDS